MWLDWRRGELIISCSPRSADSHRHTLVLQVMLSWIHAPLTQQYNRTHGPDLSRPHLCRPLSSVRPSGLHVPVSARHVAHSQWPASAFSFSAHALRLLPLPLHETVSVDGACTAAHPHDPSTARSLYLEELLRLKKEKRPLPDLRFSLVCSAGAAGWASGAAASLMSTVPAVSLLSDT